MVLRRDAARAAPSVSLNSTATFGAVSDLAPACDRQDEVTVNVIPHIPAAATRTVRDALVLAAGNGDRFKNGSSESKLLQPVLGQPLILRTLHTAREAGIRTFHIVLGYRARTLRALVEANVPAGALVNFLYNPDWQLENGLSVLAARRTLRDRRFALLMGDHLFDAAVLSRLLRTPAQPGESLLAVDSSLADPDLAAEATKVRLSGNRITAIGKELAPIRRARHRPVRLRSISVPRAGLRRRRGRHDAQRRHPQAGRARRHACGRRCRRGVVRHRHRGRPRDRRVPADDVAPGLPARVVCSLGGQAEAV